ncbi:DUF4194 domain-containing protein [Marinobacter nauticus]|uniref:DUF4194 domain-containing protein n=1 Tax=Marinobacter nauticus TaxID=2743 RepID=UPI003510D534
MTDYKENSANPSFFDRVRGQSDAHSPSSPSPDQEKDPENNSDEEEAIDAPRGDSEGGSELPHEARRVLVYLMRQGAVIGTQKPKVFESLCRYESQIRRHLAEVYLRLILDEKAGVAFVALNEAETGEDNNAIDGEPVSLISKRTLPLYDTLVLLVLRRHYQERESAGEQKITVDLERLESYLTPFLPLTNHAKADRKKLNGAVQKLTQKKILAAARGAEDRYEITPIIRYVVDAAFLESMLTEYLRLAEDANLKVDATLQLDSVSDEPQANQDDLLGGF